MVFVGLLLFAACGDGTATKGSFDGGDAALDSANLTPYTTDASVSAEVSDIKVVSYNILREGVYNTSANDIAKRSEHPWNISGNDDRRYRVVKYIQHGGASVVNLQEAEYKDQRASIRDTVSLGEDWAMIEHNTDAVRAWQQRPTIMYDTRKVVKIDAGVRKVGSNALGNPMFLSWARFQDKKSQIYFYVFNTHLSSNKGWTRAEADAARDAEMAVALNRIESIVENIDDPVIFTGDFNSPASADAIERAKAAGFLDAHDVPNIPAVGLELKTNPGFTSTAPTGGQIDHIFFKDNSRLAITSYATDATQLNNSDHLPIYATFRLTPP